MAYLLDANVFIQTKNLHYGFDFCPAFFTFMNPFQMLQNERARFVLGPQPHV
jgi:hypothetical protein